MPLASQPCGRANERRWVWDGQLFILGSMCRLSWSQELEYLYERLQAPIRAQQAAQEASQAATATARRRNTIPITRAATILTRSIGKEA